MLLVCDVGGGTTDLSVQRVSDVESGALTLRQLDVVVGRNIGSVKWNIPSLYYLDFYSHFTGSMRAYEDHVLERLGRADSFVPLGIDIDYAAWQLSKSTSYQNAKCDFGSPGQFPAYYHCLYS